MSLRATLFGAACCALLAACSSGAGGWGMDGTGQVSDGAGVLPPNAGDGSARDSTVAPDAKSPDASAPVAYQRVTIDFDELPAGTTVTDQYQQHVMLSSAAGCSIETTTSAGVAASKPSYIWTYYSCSGATSGAKGPYFVDFVKPVRQVSFTLVGVNSSDKVATLRLVFSDQSTKVSDVVGLGSYMKPVVVDLPAAKDVVRLEIVDVDDPYGLGLDDLVFDFPG